MPIDAESAAPVITRAAAHAVILLALAGVWALTGVFHLAARAARPRADYRLWSASWLFYALWLTLAACPPARAIQELVFIVSQLLVCASAGALILGCLSCLKLPPPQQAFAVLAVFLAASILSTPFLAASPLQAHLPGLVLLAVASPFAAVCLIRLRASRDLTGAALLSVGFLLWTVHVATGAIAPVSGGVTLAGFGLAALLQMIIGAAVFGVTLRQTESAQTQPGAAPVPVQLPLIPEAVAAPKPQAPTALPSHLEALGQMAGDVAHDINNALTPITAYADLLKTSIPELSPESRKHLDKISKAAEEVAGIVAHMREFYRRNLGLEMTGAGDTPLKTPAPKPAPPAAKRRARETSRPLRILCIDDEPEIRQVLHDVLELNHHKVTIANSGRKGVELFTASLAGKEPYEVVITDLGMPGMDGREVARAVKAGSPQTPVIMLTGWGAMAGINGGPGSGVDAVLGKPPRVQELGEALIRLAPRRAA